MRKNKGVSAIEVAFGAFLAIVMAAVGVDMAVLTMGFQILDSAARDAARAAGAQSTPTAAYQAATNMLTTHATDGKFILQPTLYPSSISAASPYAANYFVYEDWSQGPAPVKSPQPSLPSSFQNDSANITEYQCPYVTVTVQLLVHMPVGIPFFGDNILKNSNVNSGGYLTFLRQYTFPIVKQKLVTS